MPNSYIIDSSSLIELDRHNPMDVYPSVWKNIESLIKKVLLKAPKEVFYEIKDGDDHLAAWAKDYRDLFLEPTKRQIEVLKKILSEYPNLTKNDRRHDADPWIVALAVSDSTEPQETMVVTKTVVVTEEKIRGTKLKFPLFARNTI